MDHAANLVEIAGLYRRPDVIGLVEPEGQRRQSLGQLRCQFPPMVIILVDHGLDLLGAGREQFREKAFLGFPIAGHVTVKVEMVLGQVGENAHIEFTAVHAL